MQILSKQLLQTKQVIEKSLYSINCINRTMNRTILSMTYSPGVGQVCRQIKKHPQLADTMTLRGRSVAIITKGTFMNAKTKQIGIVTDWIIAQIKYYSNYDSFPFIINPTSNINQIVKDLSTCYGTVLLLDDQEINEIPSNLLIIKQLDVVKFVNCQITDAQATSKLISYCIENNIKGLPALSENKNFLTHQTNNFKMFQPYPHQLKDGRSVNVHALQYHKFYQGKMQIELNFHSLTKIKPLFTYERLKKMIESNCQVNSKSNNLTCIITNGTSILGLGNIGPLAGLPVMQGKSLLFKLLGDVEVVPICVYPKKSIQQEVRAIMNIVHNFEAVNLEDFKAPQCFEIESSLINMKKMPFFHDDQHGTAVVVLAGLINATKCAQKQLKYCQVVINGAGAAGMTIAKLLLHYGVKDLIVCDTKGSIYQGREQNMNDSKIKISLISNINKKKGSLSQVISGADIFIGVSAAGALKGQDVRKMNERSIVFALANPDPQIDPQVAKENGAYIYGSGRSDYPNQINNSLVFPGIFRAINQYKIKVITQDMKIKAAEAIAFGLKSALSCPHNIIPDSLDKDVAIRIAMALGKLIKIPDPSL